MKTEARCTQCGGEIEVSEGPGEQAMRPCGECAWSFDVAAEEIGGAWVAVEVRREHAPGSSADASQGPLVVFAT